MMPSRFGSAPAVRPRSGWPVRVPREAGKYFLGQALELRYRLPRLWAAVVAGTVAMWQGRRVAEATIGHDLSQEAADFVDRHVAAVAGRVRPAQLTRLVEEAIGRFMPDHAEQRRREAADGRHFDIDHDHVSFTGTSIVHGELDLADAIDLDDAIRAIANELGDLGCDESLEVRRSLAAGELTRRQLTLTLDRSDPAADTSTTNRTPVRKTVRKTVLYLHLSQAAVDGTAGHGIGRCENTRTPITACA